MNEEKLARVLEAMNLKMQQQETTLAHLAADNQLMTQRLATATPAMRSAPSGQQGLVDTRSQGKPDQFAVDGIKYSDWIFKLKSYVGAVDASYQQLMIDAETSTVPMLKGTLGHDEVR